MVKLLTVILEPLEAMLGCLRAFARLREWVRRKTRSKRGREEPTIAIRVNQQAVEHAENLIKGRQYERNGH
jgi:hypothetical protein